MNEEEKIFVGKMFDPCKDELIELKHKAHITCQRFNAMDEYDTNRLPMIKEILGAIGEGYYLQGPVQFNYGCHTYIGSNFFANFNLVVLDDAEIHIGDNVCLGPNVSLMAASHPLLANERMSLDAHAGLCFKACCGPYKCRDRACHHRYTRTCRVCLFPPDCAYVAW